MDPKVFRKLFRGIVGGSLPAFVFIQPTLPPENPSGMRFSGCYGIGYSCSAQPGQKWEKTFENIEVSDDQLPLSYKKCLALCGTGAKLKTLPPIGDFDVAYYEVNGCKSKQTGKLQVKIDCTYSKGCPSAGRRPNGLQKESERTAANEVGQWFVNMAYLEEAAVVAFEYLTKELEAYNAPEELIQVAKEAIDEEREHTILTKALAARYDATPLAVEVEPFVLRPLAEIAYDNLAEGCIRETYGALSAVWQTEHAEDEAVRAVTHRIVHEESRHAALSWDIHRWLWPQLTPQEQQKCQEIADTAIQELEASIQEEPPYNPCQDRRPTSRPKSTGNVPTGEDPALVLSHWA